MTVAPRAVAGGVWGSDMSVVLVVADVDVSVGAGPAEGAGSGAFVGPAAVGLEPVVEPAQGSEVAGAGRSALFEGDDVVAVAMPGWSGAVREHARRAESR
jgi:hypothetical protein